MKIYTIWFFNCDNHLDWISFEAESEEEIGSYTLLQWVSDTYDIDYGDVYTDGVDVWYERNGEQHVIMKDIFIEEAE